MEQKEGRQEEHSRPDGWGSLTRRHEAATAVRGQETPRAVGMDRPGLYLEGTGGVTAFHGAREAGCS